MARSAVTDDLSTALSEQSGVLMAAKTLDSDLDFAYQLQMQEAINASLALQPSSSGSPPSPPSPNVDVYSPNDGVLDIAATLMMQDLDRYMQEHFDRKRSEAEMRRMRENLDRRIHDQKFADYILNISDEEWRIYGDNYHRPYGIDASSSSSSSTALVDTECFRLYFKGLVSEENVRGMKVMVAGTGVAICDSKDRPILEEKKNLEAFVDDQVVTNEVATLEALIEGLDRALSLDLKRITFFCDHYNVHQYVSPILL